MSTWKSWGLFVEDRHCRGRRGIAENRETRYSSRYFEEVSVGTLSLEKIHCSLHHNDIMMIKRLFRGELRQDVSKGCVLGLRVMLPLNKKSGRNRFINLAVFAAVRVNVETRRLVFSFFLGQP